MAAFSVAGLSNIAQTLSGAALTDALPSPRRRRSAPPVFGALAEEFAGAAISLPRMISENLAGASGNSTSVAPSASATAFATQTGVDMQLPSPTPFDPRCVKGDGV